LSPAQPPAFSEDDLGFDPVDEASDGDDLDGAAEPDEEGNFAVDG